MSRSRMCPSEVAGGRTLSHPAALQYGLAPLLFAHVLVHELYVLSVGTLGFVFDRFIHVAYSHDYGALRGVLLPRRHLWLLEYTAMYGRRSPDSRFSAIVRRKQMINTGCRQYALSCPWHTAEQMTQNFHCMSTSLKTQYGRHTRLETHTHATPHTILPETCISIANRENDDSHMKERSKKMHAKS